MMGDNLYGGSAPNDFEKKFEAPYKPLLDSGMKFYASLGNHDNPNERYYKMFNMSGERFYTFKPRTMCGSSVSTATTWTSRSCSGSRRSSRRADPTGKICFFHHPLYSSGGTTAPTMQLREQLEPLFLKYGRRCGVSAATNTSTSASSRRRGFTNFISGGGAGKCARATSARPT